MGVQQKNNSKQLMESISHNLAYDIVKKLLLVIFSSGSTFTGSFIVFKKIGLPVWCTTVLCFSIAALVAFIALTIMRAMSNRYTRSEKIESDYEILEKTVSFKYDGTKCYYDTEIKLVFNKKTREYYGKFYWSGSGSGKIKPANKNYALNELKRRNRYIEYVVVFDRVYKKGQKLTLKLSGEMDDPQKEFSPYFATTVNSPTRRLKIVLHIDPQKYPIEELEKDIIPPAHSGHENCEQVQLDDSGVYAWEIDAPMIAYQYSLNWSFK